ncbi:toll/interleukin-1 receptor domain-containing protein [Tardiphaga sp.]|jgi:hypothetical protein|uniref:toll/interleukin-1 receptor domain-containing protein n=1 Tax=Tardiphaga sp. TaxID=1926292 RepID=UPI0037DA2705
MSVPTASDPGSASSRKLKVFLSYSRKDSAFAEDPLAALELGGFDAYLDKQDIAPAEPWEARLANLIRLADTVVFIISPNSLASSHCNWEVEETTRCGKRLIPLIFAPVPDEDVHPQLKRLNYVQFASEPFLKSVGELARALRADAGWIREHTRYGELAIRWAERNRPDALLLRGSDLDDAKRWAIKRPGDAPEISAGQQSYIEASSRAADNELSAKASLRSRVLAGLLAASAAFALLAAASIVLWRMTAAAEAQLAAKNTELDAANARLKRKLALRVSPLGYMPYDVPAGWFQIATGYTSAVAFVEQRSKPGQITASGVLRKGKLLDPAWSDRPVFVTASYVIGNQRQFISALDPAEVDIVMLGPGSERQKTRLGILLWQSDSLGVSVSSVEGNLPAYAEPIKSANAAPSALANLDRLTVEQVKASFDDRAMLQSKKDPRPIVFIGNLQGRNEVAVSISHLFGALEDWEPEAAKAIPNFLSPTGQAIRSAPQRINDQVRPDLVYTHGTLPGSGGSPLFDAETGDLIGIHLMSYPCVQPVAPDRRCEASGTSFPRLLAAIRNSREPTDTRRPR